MIKKEKELRDASGACFVDELMEFHLHDFSKKEINKVKDFLGDDCDDESILEFIKLQILERDSYSFYTKRKALLGRKDKDIFTSLHSLWTTINDWQGDVQRKYLQDAFRKVERLAQSRYMVKGKMLVEKAADEKSGFFRDITRELNDNFTWDFDSKKYKMALHGDSMTDVQYKNDIYQYFINLQEASFYIGDIAMLWREREIGLIPFVVDQFNDNRYKVSEEHHYTIESATADVLARAYIDEIREILYRTFSTQEQREDAKRAFEAMDAFNDVSIKFVRKDYFSIQ